MKRELIRILVCVLLLSVLTVPFSAHTAAASDVTVTTTMPLTTTSTGYDCISTTPPPTTTTSLVLTGPDGINPDYTTTVPTTTTTTTAAPSVCGDSVDLLSDADITVSDTMAILGHPAGGNWLSVDCYSYDGGTITIVPPRGNRVINANRPYLHVTIIANVPFTLTMTEAMGVHNAVDWVGEANVNEDGTIKAGAYVLSARVDSVFDYCNYADKVTVTLTAPGSVTVGHIALSDEEVCGESAPRIQTTTRPSFPWDDTTTAPDLVTTLPTTTTTTLVLTGPDGTNTTTSYPPTTTTTRVLTGDTTFVTSTTTPTTNPTVGDALVPGDADGDGIVTTSDARVILTHCLLGNTLSGDAFILADYNGDGAVTTLDTRVILRDLIG